SLKNGVNPEAIVEEYGADALRCFEMFMGPLEATKPWDPKGVEGLKRFLNRVWRLAVDDAAEQTAPSPILSTREPNRDELRVLHRTIRGVTDDLDHLRFNTAIAKMMEFVNFLTPLADRPRAMVEPLVLLLAPFAPHVAEELWEILGRGPTLAYEPWPTFDEGLCAADAVEIVVQINSKVRSKVTAPVDVTDADLIELARSDEKIVAGLAGKEVVKSFVVSNRTGKLVNFVVKD
ncbi:MAG: class I tRNA ligase family protein, partial [Planctomycetia bacterium]